MINAKNLLSKDLSKIQLVVTDVDGVLTDGGLFFSSEGLVMKQFNVKDGMGVRLLKEIGVDSGILTTDDSPVNKARAVKLGMNFVYTQVRDKEEKIKEICSQKNIPLENVVFIGDDVNDIGILKIVGFSACPSDAILEVLESVNYVCKKQGGQGVFREIADLILSAHKK